MAPRRDWSAARAKVEREGACRYCGRRDRRLEAAHIIGRRYDRRVGQRVVVSEDEIVPLCGGLDACHGAYDRGEIDLLPYTTYQEQAAAVALVGIERARARLTGSDGGT